MGRTEDIAKWDAIYRGYDEDPSPEIFALAQQLKEILLKQVGPGASLLEVGCGAGHLSGLLVREGFRASLVDFSEQALAAAKRYFSRAGVTGEFIKGDLFRLDEALGERRYDLVWNSGVLEHYGPEKALEAVEQMARHSDQCVMALVPNGDCLFYRLWRWRQMVTGKWSFSTEFAYRSLQHIFEAAGLERVVEQTCGRDWALWMASEVVEDPNVVALVRQFSEQQVAAPHLTDYLLVTVGRVTKRRAPRLPKLIAPDLKRESSLEVQVSHVSEALASVTRQLQDEREQVEQLQAQLSQSRESAEALQRRISELEIESAMHRQAVAERANSLGALRTELAQERQQRERVEAEASRAAAQLQAELSQERRQRERQQAEADRTAAQLSQSRESAEALQRRISELEIESAMQRQAVAERTNTLSALWVDLAQERQQRERQQAEADQTAAQLSEARETAARQHLQQAEALQHRISELEIENAMHRQAVAERTNVLSALRVALAQERQQRERQQAEVDQTFAQLSEAREAAARQHLQETEALQRRISELEIESAMHRQAVAERANTISALWIELARERQREEQERQQRERVEAEASQAAVQLQAELAQERQQRERVEAEASQAAAQLQAELTQERQDREWQQAEAGQTLAQLQTLQSEAGALQREVVELRAERTALMDAMRKLEEAVRSYECSFYFRWRRRGRRLVAEFILGDFKQKRVFLAALWGWIQRQGRKLRRASPASVPAEPPSLPEIGLHDALGSGSTIGPYDVLLFPIIEWEGRFQRPQQLGTQLVRKGHRLFCMATNFVEAPAGQASYRDIAERVQVRELGDGIYWVELVATARLAKWEEIPNIYQSHLEDEDDFRYLTWSLRALRERYHLQNTISIVDLPFWGPLARALPHNQVVYDCMDEHSGFSTTGTLAPIQEAALLPQADLVLFTARTLLAQKGQLNPRHLLLPNACDYEHFASTQQSPPPDDLPEAKGPIIGYYGAIAHWFDSALVAAVARAHPEWTFVLIGSTFTSRGGGLSKMKNVRLLGEKPYAELPAYLNRFDVCLIPFVIDKLTQATNPVKFYEYLATGKPVVATPLPELLPYRDQGLVEIAETAEAFGAAIGRALTDDTEENREKRRRFAQEQTWESRGRAFEEAIRQHLYPRVSVIIVTYNNWAHTRRCLDSLFRNSHYPDLEIVVVDNCSTDETRAELERLSPSQIKLILNEQNLGFAAGTNRGLEAATGEILVLLNNDTQVTPDWVKGVLSGFEAPDVGMVGPVTNFCGNDQITPFFVGKERTPLEEVDLEAILAPYRGRRRETDRFGFFCVAMRREVYQKVGGLDEGYQVGMFEDDDYCHRVQQAGYRLLVVEDVFIYHYGKASFGRLPAEEYRRIWDLNRAYYESKWGTWQAPRPPAAERLFRMSGPELVVHLIEAKQPALVIAPTIDWHSPRQRPQQLARAFAHAEIMTFYVTPNSTHDRVAVYEEVEPLLFLVSHLSVAQTVFHCKVDMLLVPWATNNDYLDAQAHQVAIYDYMDDVDLLRPHCADVNERHRIMLERAEIVTASSQVLFESVRQERPEDRPCLYLPNAADYDHFHREQRPEPPEDLLPVLDLGKPILGYYGAFGRWFDVDLVEAVAEGRPDWSLMLIGPDYDRTLQRSKALDRHGNLFWLGTRPYGKLPSYLAWFDVAMIPFKANRVTASVSPIKLFEYLAGGKPVVTTDLPECRGRPGVQVASTARRFLQGVDEAFARRNDPEFLRQVDQHARENSWDARLRLLLETVRSLDLKALTAP